jgi:hypothetical protein
VGSFLLRKGKNFLVLRQKIFNDVKVEREKWEKRSPNKTGKNDKDDRNKTANVNVSHFQGERFDIQNVFRPLPLPLSKPSKGQKRLNLSEDGILQMIAL